MSKKKKTTNNKSKEKPAFKRGFLTDFSQYRYSHFSIEEAYREEKLIKKLGDFIREALWTENLYDLHCLGLKFEKLNPRTDKRMISICDDPTTSNLVYASFPKSPLGFVFSFNTSTRIIRIFGLDTKHVIRPFRKQVR